MTVGNVKVTSIYELDASDVITEVIKDANSQNIKDIEWLFPHYADADGSIKAVNQSFLLEMSGKKILIDTCVGNKRTRPELPAWDGLETSFMNNLTKQGVRPEEVDMVLCTHLHFDHIGWNTHLVNGEWTPTFPNAEYIFVRQEYEYWQSRPDKELIDDHNGVNESIRPVVKAGLVRLVDKNAQITPEIRLVHTPGHTPHHVSILLESDGESALFSGDVFHHPCQIAHPEWMSFDTEPASALTSRKQVLEQYADTKTVIFGAHFSEPAGSRIITDGTSYKLARSSD